MSWVRHTLDGIVWRCATRDADWLRASGILSLAAGLGAGEVPERAGGDTRLELRKDVALKRVVRLGTIRDGQTQRLLVKVYKPRKGIAGLRQRLGKSEADRETAVAEELAERGVSCVVPLALGRARAEGLGRPSLVLFEEVEGVPLDRYLRGDATSPGLDQRPRTRLAACRAVGAFARSVHDAGVFQDDFDPNNILVRARTAGGGSRLECVLVDYERVKLLPRRTVQAWAKEKSDRLFQQRCWALAKMNRFDAVRATERWAFFRGYIEGAPRLESQRSWFAIEILRTHGEVLARDIRKAMVDCTRENRNFHHRNAGSWDVWERRAWPRWISAELPAPRPAPGNLDSIGSMDSRPAQTEVCATIVGQTSDCPAPVAMTAEEAKRVWAARQALMRIGIPVQPAEWMAVDARRKVGVVMVSRLPGTWAWSDAASGAGSQLSPSLHGGEGGEARACTPGGPGSRSGVVRDEGAKGGREQSEATPAELHRGIPVPTDDRVALADAAGHLFGKLVRAGCWIEPLSLAAFDVQFSGDRVRRCVVGRIERVREIRPIAPRASDPAVEATAERLQGELRSSLGDSPAATAAFDGAWRRLVGRWKRGGGTVARQAGGK